MLLIPKQHVRYVWDIEDAGGFFSLAQKLAKHLQRVSGSQSVMSVTIGEMIPHAHLHLVPDTKGNRDKVFERWSEALTMRKLPPEKMDKIREKFSL